MTQKIEETGRLIKEERKWILVVLFLFLDIKIMSPPSFVNHCLDLCIAYRATIPLRLFDYPAKSFFYHVASIAASIVHVSLFRIPEI